MAISSEPASGRIHGFTPALALTLRGGYGLAALRADALAGLTVAIVALPLSMAIAIASGVGPERGLYTAIVGGFIVSALGGCRFQIGGPAGAFIVMVAACVAQIGVQGLLLATLMSGAMLVVLGVLRLGSFIRLIPHPVVVGFSAGIAAIILASQIKDLMGLTLVSGEPAALLPRLGAMWAARGTASPAAVALALGSVAVIVLCRRWVPHLPGMLVAVAGGAAVAGLAGLPVDTIATRFGALPRVLPSPAIPEISWAGVQGALPFAGGFALLGAIESLLSAVVADRMSGDSHRPGSELVAQGLANIGAAVFGGFCVTGTIARTATNVRAGAHGPVSGMLHAVFLLVFMAVAAPLAGYVPLAVLAGVLAVVAWNMVERAEIAQMLRRPGADVLIMAGTLLMVTFTDLVAGIATGCLLAGLFYLLRRRGARKT